MDQYGLKHYADGGTGCCCCCCCCYRSWCRVPLLARPLSTGIPVAVCARLSLVSAAAAVAAAAADAPRHSG